MMELILLVVLIVGMKIIAKVARMHVANDTVVDIADRWGYISHVVLGYLAAYLLPQGIAGLMVIIMFAFYEVMHFIFPESREAIIEFMISYVSTLIYLYQVPIKI